MRRFGLLVFLLTSGLFCGCVRTTQPILKDDQVIEDKSLVGRWVDTEGKTFADVTEDPAYKLLRIYKLTITDKDGKKAPLLARLGKIDGLTVAELRAELADDNSEIYSAHLLPLYSFLVIKQTHPNLIVAMMEQEWLEKYLHEHPDELQVARPDAANLIVTAPTAEFQKFLLRHFKDEGALKAEAKYVRAAAPTTQAASSQPSK